MRDATQAPRDPQHMAGRQAGSTPPAIPLNFFGMPFGCLGLATAWLTAAQYQRAPRAVGEWLLVLSALVWLLVTVVYLQRAVRSRSLSRDLTDPVGGPFAALCVVVPMVIAAYGLFPLAPEAGRVVVDVFLALTVLLGAWFTGQWIYGRVDIDRFHPGYFLPTVAGDCSRRGRPPPWGNTGWAS